MGGRAAAWGKILTKDNLRKRRITLVDWCCSCRCSGESMDNLLLHCNFAFSFWGLCFFIFLESIERCHIEYLIYWLGGGIGSVNACLPCGI